MDRSRLLPAIFIWRSSRGAHRKHAIEPRQGIPEAPPTLSTVISWFEKTCGGVADPAKGFREAAVIRTPHLRFRYEPLDQFLGGPIDDLADGLMQPLLLLMRIEGRHRLSRDAQENAPKPTTFLPELN